MYAVLRQKFHVAKRLIESGADVNRCTGGEFRASPLYMAAVCRNLEIMDRLI
jgi:hypothetical protein